MKQIETKCSVIDVQCLNNIADTNNKSSDETKSKYGLKADLAQLLATLVQGLLLVNVGMELAMSTIVIGSLYKNSEAEFELTDSQSSWFGSILYLCQPIGSVLSGYAQKHFGKKSCVVLACVPSIIGWTMLRYSNSVTMLNLSTVTMGMGLGFTDGPAYSYIGEICEPRLRGIMSCVVNMACLIGVLITYGSGFVLQWRTVALVNLMCPITCLFLVMFIPESPIWLISKGKNKRAMDAVCWLRGWVEPGVVTAEFQELLYYYKKSVEQAKVSNQMQGMFASFGWLKDPSVYRPLRLVSLYYIFTLISCLTPCRPYIVELMYESGVKDTHSIALVLFGLMQLTGSIILTLIVRFTGKRMLTLTTLAVNTVTILVFGVYIACIQHDVFKSDAYVPMLLYSIIMLSGAMGMLTVPWTLVSEIYPNEAKGFASSLTTAIFYVLTFSTTKVYLNVENALGLTNTLFTVASLCVVGFLYLYKNLPETESKTFLEIEEFFVPKKHKSTMNDAQAPDL